MLPMHILSFLLTCLIVFSPNAVNAESSLQTAAKQAIVIDYDTGNILFSKNADARMPTSSMSKVLSMVVVFDALKAGHIKLDDTMLVSEKAWRKGGSKMFVEVDKRVKIEDLIRGVIIQSGNDATIVLAEGLAGSEDAFANLLNQKAQSLDMNDSNFMNASGWPDPNHYSTAADLAKLADYLIREYPEYYKYYSETEFEFNDIKQPNRNPLLYRGIGADGIKTGHTEAGGYGLIGSGTHNGRRVILVVNGLESSKDRASESSKLLEWGLKNFVNKTVFKAGQEIEAAEVAMGQGSSVPLTLKEDLTLTLPALSAKSMNVRAIYDGPLVAPIAKGQVIGTLEINLSGLEPIKRELVAGADIAELGFFKKTIAKAKVFLKGQ